MYSESSCYQSYMIFYKNLCVGAVYIDAISHKKNLKTRLFINEKIVTKHEEIFDIVDQLVNSLCIYFYDKESIKIDFVNSIDLSKFDFLKYKRTKDDYDKIIYTYKNVSKISKVINEIVKAKENLTNLGLSWCQEINNWFDLDYCDIDIDEDLISQYYNNTIKIPKYFYKASILKWKNIDSEKNILFNRNGQIIIEKETNKKNDIDYEATYDISSNEFLLKAFNKKEHNFLEITSSFYFTSITTDNLNITELNNREKIVNYKDPIENNSSIDMELYIDEQDQIEKCYIAFKTHKENGKVNGQYILRILPYSQDFQNLSKFIIRVVNIKGNGYNDTSNILKDKETQLFETIYDGNINIDLIDELINKLITIINSDNPKYKKQKLSNDFTSIIKDWKNIKYQALNVVKQIKGEIPLPHLEKNLNNFIESYEINDNKTYTKKYSK